MTAGSPKDSKSLFRRIGRCGLFFDIGQFGKGWSYNLGSYLKMYSEFDMAEFRADGSIISYTFVQDDPNAFVNSFDGDNMINYDLNKGIDYHGSCANGETFTYKYDVAGQTIAFIDGIGRKYTINYDDTGRPVSIKDAQGLATAIERDALGRVIKVTSPGEKVTSFEYGPLGVTKASGPLGTYNYTYNARKQITSIKDELGRTITIEYDAVGRVTAKTDALGNRTSFQYDAAGNRISETGPDGITYRYGQCH